MFAVEQTLVGASFPTKLLVSGRIADTWRSVRSMTDSVVGTENVMCSASSPAIVFQVGWALHFFGDILSMFVYSRPWLALRLLTAANFSKVFCLPWLIIPDLKIRRSLKIGVYCTFGLGIINMTFSLVRFITIQTAPVEVLPFGLVGKSLRQLGEPVVKVVADSRNEQNCGANSMSTLVYW